MENRSTESQSGYKVRLENFEGPLDLLLFLIKQQEIDIYDIPIASITKQYLDYIGLMQSLDLEVAGEYLVMAATLLLIKSRMLLPQEMVDEDVEGDDPRQELVQRLLEYQQYKEVATSLSDREEEQRHVFLRQSCPPEEEGEGLEAFQKVTLFDLLSAFRQALQRISEPSFYPIHRNALSVEDKIEEISQRLSRQGKILFVDLLASDATRAALVVTFIALLEMIRKRSVIIKQTKLFGDIWLFRPES
ncbi:MAG: segregation/condensation protein A [Gemmatimonadota bacterium]|nr:MAG: segregation/condensation protein A [Gemmatimonadota bacterium]